uniref:Uncharacterized protein n=1 Tax=Steinernema glaseri TaxID=37863 RepID=A0A1I8A0P6_9BILA
MRKTEGGDDTLSVVTKTAKVTNSRRSEGLMAAAAACGPVTLCPDCARGSRRCSWSPRPRHNRPRRHDNDAGARSIAVVSPRRVSQQVGTLTKRRCARALAARAVPSFDSGLRSPNWD